jgi:plastocyanin
VHSLTPQFLPHPGQAFGGVLAQADANVEVEMQTLDSGQHFHPHVAWVAPGGTVTFHNASGTHTATAYHPDNDKPLRIPEGAEPFDSGLLTEEGATFEHTFETEGVYDVYCKPHEQLGMIGTVLVGEPDPHGQPGLAEPQSEMSDAVASKIHELNEQVDTMLGHEH